MTFNMQSFASHNRKLKLRVGMGMKLQLEAWRRAYLLMTFVDFMPTHFAARHGSDGSLYVHCEEKYRVHKLFIICIHSDYLTI